MSGSSASWVTPAMRSIGTSSASISSVASVSETMRRGLAGPAGASPLGGERVQPDHTLSPAITMNATLPSRRQYFMVCAPDGPARRTYLGICGKPLPPTPSPQRRGGARQVTSLLLLLSLWGRGLGGGVSLSHLSDSCKEYPCRHWR